MQFDSAAALTSNSHASQVRLNDKRLSAYTLLNVKLHHFGISYEKLEEFAGRENELSITVNN